MQFGARGISVLVPSGDGGVSGASNSSCTEFVPTFPSGCPFVTSVGATTGFEEIAAPSSAGGFSNYFATPSYQLPAVNSYLSALDSRYDGLFNRSGRGYPDISALGANIKTVVNGEVSTLNGTSGATTIVASAVALLNDRLISAGGPSVGYLNDCINNDDAVSGLTDINTGSNPGCGTDGFPTLSGAWDPVTGLGTPYFPELLKAALGAGIHV
ncbi:peptidase S8/S53 domain-containing protein [Phellopilus nigrolimitatus]|nr:peptidase S8/S53 domain-containing protein [Phellopilus nigrolimitatus]